MCWLTCQRQCHQSFPPSSTRPTRRSSCCSPLRRIWAPKTATSKCNPTSGRDVLMVGIYLRRSCRAHFEHERTGIHIINIGKTWEKLVFAARIIAAVENPNDIVAISARPYGHRAVLKFAANTGAQAIAGRFTPGSFTNYITRSFKEPRLIIVTDPRVDHQAIREASY